MSLPLAALAATSADVAATTKRIAKVDALARLFQGVDPDEAPLVVGYLAGAPPQGRVGIGWASLRDLPAARAARPTLTVADVDAAITDVAALSGPGSASDRQRVLTQLILRATSDEAAFVMHLLLGDLRQGANEGLVLEAIAKAANVPPAKVRRALMLSGDLGLTARVALGSGVTAVEAIGLEIMRPLRPMLASTASDVAEAVEALGMVSVEWKLDGARIQAHKSGDRVRIWTRNLNEVGERLPTVVETVRGLDAQELVLDGEVLGIGGDSRPRAFQDSMSDFGSDDAAPDLVPFFFDLLHVDGADLVDSPLAQRLPVLTQLAGRHKVPGTTTSDVVAAEALLADALAHGHEGVVIKALDAPYAAGRRGKAWRKVKPVHTLDLVVLAVEWGHGRRQGWLSNLHLGARSRDGGFVMVGKTFKGLTDELLRWQTERFLALKTHQEGIVVHVRPEQVVEVAVDGVQTSTRYPGGVALRFARVRRYRPDRDANTADTIETVRSLG